MSNREYVSALSELFGKCFRTGLIHLFLSQVEQQDFPIVADGGSSSVSQLQAENEDGTRPGGAVSGATHHFLRRFLARGTEEGDHSSSEGPLLSEQAEDYGPLLQQDGSNSTFFQKAEDVAGGGGAPPPAPGDGGAPAPTPPPPAPGGGGAPAPTPPAGLEPLL